MKHIELKEWALLFLAFVIILFIVISVWTANHLVTFDMQYENAFRLRISILSFAQFLFFLSGSVLTIISYFKEEKDMKLRLCMVGYPLLFIFGIVSLFI